MWKTVLSFAFAEIEIEAKVATRMIWTTKQTPPRIISQASSFHMQMQQAQNDALLGPILRDPKGCTAGGARRRYRSILVVILLVILVVIN
mmetsp:Transcript_29820/g.52362  ORF Transcript_29820/g.52362 Transcript_29820/m.52362 type:complete len:90 (-) Transcript_29820:144-413(-)